MIKLAKYLKPFLAGLVIAIVLLFAQAMFDLNLPNYMSNIVNIGIQQNGIIHGAPEAISQEGLEFMKVLMTDQDIALIDDNYTLVSGTDTNPKGKPYKDIYPASETAQIYLLNPEISEGTLEAIDNSFGTTVWTMLNIIKSMSQENTPTDAGEESTMDLQTVDVTKLYKMKPVFEQLPQSVVEEAREKTKSMDDATLKQSGTIMVSSFYRELGADIGKIQNSYILNVGFWMLLIALGSGIATILVSLLSSRIAAGVAKNLRNDIFEKVEKFSNSEYDKFSTASLITRSTNDVTQIQQFLLMGIRMIFFAPIMGIGGIIMALNKSVSMGWIIAVAVVVLIGFIVTIFSIVLPKFSSMQKFVDKLNLVARETLNGLMVIRAFGTSDFEKKRFDAANQDLASTNLFVNRTMTFMMPIMMLIMNSVTLLVIWVGSHQVAQSTMQVGDMMAFMQYAMQIIMSFLMVSMMFIFIPRASVSARRIAEVLEVKPTIIDPDKSLSMETSQKGYVTFKDVSFRYSGAEEEVLRNISFTAKPGETTAFIGATGSGKSTIVNLIPRFYDVTEGEILVGGVNVKDISQKELRSHIGYVPQKSVLMSGTIESNIKYGREDLTEEELKKVVEVAQAYDFISQKSKGFESEIAQGGANVSGGQKQRLSIARALAVKPDIYIFDDSFSALDFKTDATLREALGKHTGDSTVIIVAQRVSTIMNANQIFVIDDGEIVGHGTHRDLLKSCTQYYEIASSQLSKEELENE